MPISDKEEVILMLQTTYSNSSSLYACVSVRVCVCPHPSGWTRLYELVMRVVNSMCRQCIQLLHILGCCVCVFMQLLI